MSMSAAKSPLLALLPTSLAVKLVALEEERAPFRPVHRLIDALEVLVKYHTVAVISQFSLQPEVSPTVRAMLAAGLRTPTLGIWWRFAREGGRTPD